MYNNQTNHMKLPIYFINKGTNQSLYLKIKLNPL